jgi:protein transport protein SEC24
MALDSQQDAPLDVVNFGSTGIVRCKKCRAYVNPFVAWVNNGRQWRCNVCGFSNDVPNSYFCQLDERGRRRDRDQRPELSKGSVELVAPGEYMVRPPQPPVYVFAIDVSAPSVASGLVNVAASTIKKCLDQLPGAPRTQVAVVTYDSSVHFYNLKASLKQPSMLTVPDLTDLFVPLPDDLLVNLAESRESIDMLLDSLPQMHASSPSPASCLGAALTAAYRVMGHVGGKLCVFQSQLPNCGEAPLKNRENPRAYGTDGERMLLLAEQSKGKSPEQTTASWYETRAIEFSRLQIGVELFVAPPSNAYVDLATLALLPKITAGQLYYYPQFSHKKDSAKLEAELTRALTRPTGFEAVMRVRCTRGLRVSAFRGNYYVRGHDLLALPNCTPESVFALEIAHDAEAPLTAGAASVQASLLYTTSSGERRIRVHTLVLPTSPDVGVVAASADVDVVANLLAKASVEATLKAGLDAARSRLQQRCIDVVAACRHGRSSASVGGYGAPAVRGAPAAPQTPSQPPKLPESLQLLPLYCMALLKSAAFRGGADVRADERSYTLQRLDGMAPEQTRSFVYPRLFALHKLPPSQTPFQFPPPLNLSAESISSDGIYLLDDSLQLMVWVGGASDPKLCDSLFLQDPSDGRVMLKPEPQGDSPLSRACKVIAELRKTRPAYLALEIIREGDPQRQPVFFRHLVEDHASFPGGQYSYQEFMAHVSRHA